MAGPSFVHYNTSSGIVSGVFTTSRTAISGETEVLETHPPFNPPPSSKIWIRTAPTTYVLTDVDASAKVSTPFFTGIINVSSVGDSHASWGSLGGLSDITTPYSGRLLSVTVSPAQTRTAGTCEIFFTINGIAQNDNGSAFTIDGTNPNGGINVLTSPILFNAEDRISIIAVTTSFSLAPQSLTISLVVETN
jgi:hypothetical protein